MRMTRDNWIVLGILLAVVATFAGVAFYPQQRKLGHVRQEIVRADQQLVADRQAVACVPEMVQQVDELKRRFKNFDRRLPAQQELSEFLKEISTTVLAERLENQVIQPGNPTRGDLYNRLPILLQFEGGFQGLANFLSKLDQMERLTQIESIVVRPVKPESDRLKVEMKVNIYFTES